MSDLLKLAEACEAATGPDRRLDDEIHVAVTSFEPRVGGVGWPDGVLVVPAFPGWKPLPDYTASIDAAMTLLPGSDWEWALEWETGSLLYHPDAEMFARAEIGDPCLRMEAEALTLPLALCAAALKARAYVARSEAAAVGGR